MLCKTIAPLHDLDLGRDASFQLAPGARFVPIPDWLRTEPIIKRLSQPDQDGLATCTHCLLLEYKGDEVSELLVSRRDERRSKEGDGRSVRAVKSDLVYLANLAVWLQRLPRVGFDLVFHAREGSGAFDITEDPERHDRFLYHANDDIHRRKITCDDLKSVQRLYAALSKIQRHSAPWAALRAVTSGLQMQRNEIRHLLLWIALEALFGVADGEIKYRLSQRLAFFVANDRDEAGELFAKAKQGYDARCKIAHGTWGPKTINTDEAGALTGITEEFIRRAFIRLLQDDQTTKHFSGSEKNRSAYLDQLPFKESIGQPGTTPTSA